ncbi:MAG: MFS transporter [Thermoguttaceae bacterium]|nr:MFS transporter [Thermoguttaceae bacterium]
MAEEKSGGLSMYPRLQFAYLLQFAIWGSWNIALGALAAEKGFNPGALYSFFALGALFAPLIGPIADKKFAAQKVLAFMHLVGGLTLLYCHKVVSADVVNMTTLKALMFVAGLAYMPSIPLVNAVVFKHIPDKDKSSLVFIFGTIGWILVNLVVKPHTFYMIGGLVSIGLALYALTLPNTPPAGSTNKDPFGLKAFALFKRWDFTLFLLCAFFVSIFGSNFYFPMFGGYVNDVLGVSTERAALFGTLNQCSELLFMAALAFAVGRIGLKGVLTLGLFAWTLRYFLFSTGTMSLAVAGILLHGLAYAFLYTASYMFGDKVAPDNLKASVQSLIAFLLLGVGQFISGFALDNLKPMYPMNDVAAVTEAGVNVDAATTALPTALDYLKANVEDAVVSDTLGENQSAFIAAFNEFKGATGAKASADVKAKRATLIEKADAYGKDLAKVDEQLTKYADDKNAEFSKPIALAQFASDVVAAEDPKAFAAKKLEEVKGWTDSEQIANDVVGAVGAVQATAGAVDWKHLLYFPIFFCLVFSVIFLALGKEPKAAEATEA